MDFEIVRSGGVENESFLGDFTPNDDITLLLKASQFISAMLTGTAIDSRDKERVFVKGKNVVLCLVFSPKTAALNYFMCVGIDIRYFKNNLTLDRIRFDKNIEKIIQAYILENEDLLRILENEHLRLLRHLKNDLDDQVIKEFSVRVAYFVDSFVQKGFLLYGRFR